MKKKTDDLEMLEEYDFRGGIQGKYVKRFAKGTNIVVIELDVAEYFAEHESVNEALRGIGESQKTK